MGHVEGRGAKLGSLKNFEGRIKKNVGGGGGLLVLGLSSSLIYALYPYIHPHSLRFIATTLKQQKMVPIYQMTPINICF